MNDLTPHTTGGELADDFFTDLALVHIVTQRQRFQKMERHLKENMERYSYIFSQLPEDLRHIVSIDSSGKPALSWAGTRSELQAVVGLLRRNGFKPNRRPGANDTSYMTYFTRHHAGQKDEIWLGFSSTQCRRVKVGTELVEQDVYEIQCGETLEDLR